MARRSLRVTRAAARARSRRYIFENDLLEALRDVIQSRVATMDEVSRAADRCRMSRVMQPYLEALLS
jgi:hypothetical protein